MKLAIGLLLAAFVVGTVSMAVMAGNGTCQRDRDQVRDPDTCPNCDCPNPDCDGDGICDNCGECIYNPDAPDDDGDGIPNGQDDDYVPTPAKDGSGCRR